MSKIIQVEKISKRYQIGHRTTDGSNSLIADALKALRHPSSWFNRKTDEFWALKNVSFDVDEGEVVGIIGRNGSGKSTLLKVLSQITEPTSGKAILHGRVASLLEVGTGFHPELTGRENIYFNGSILGMTRREINQKFDEIVEFAEIGQFLDTPVKFYSSGMYVRLAFAVAAHLEPDVLIVDEVLAVGDATFQKKCLGKMGSVAKEGRTVLFVSHNMLAVEQLCNSIIHLDKGRVVNQGKDVKGVIKEYLFGSSDADVVTSEWKGKAVGKDCMTVTRLAVVDGKGETITGSIGNRDDVWVQIEGKIDRLDPLLSVGYALYSEDGSPLFWCFHTDLPEEEWPKLKVGKVKMRSQLPKRFLNDGVYRVELVGSLFARGWFYEPGSSAAGVYLSVGSTPSGSPYWISTRPTLLAPAIGWEVL